MKRTNLMTGLIGLALLAAPISAAAQDRDSGKFQSRPAQTQPQAHREVPTQKVAPAPVTRNEPRAETRNEPRNEKGYWAHPMVPAKPEAREVRKDNDRNHDGDRDYRNYGDRDHDRDYRNYGDRDFDHDRDYAANGWVMPRGYVGGACAWAQHLRNVYRHDEYTGHPAAAADLLPQLRRAERNCGGVPYGFNLYR